MFQIFNKSNRQFISVAFALCCIAQYSSVLADGRTSKNHAIQYLENFANAKQLPAFSKRPVKIGSQGAHQKAIQRTSSAQQLYAELDSFIKQFDGLAGSDNSVLSRIQNLFSTQTDLSDLSNSYSQLKIQHQLYQAHFSIVRKKIAESGVSGSYQSRLVEAENNYWASIGAFFEVFDVLLSLNSENQAGSFANKVRSNFQLSDARESIAQIRKLVNSEHVEVLRNNVLPYKSLSLPAKSLQTQPIIVPSYLLETPPTPTAEDTATHALTEPVLQLAKELQYDPIKLFEFVNSQIESEYYYGAMKGATNTLLQGAGNSTDQASLLIDLLRASSIPARFTYGVIRLPAGMLTEMLGVEDVNQAAIAIRRAGIPSKSVIAGGRVIALDIQHTWVSAYVPYANYRGATVDTTGKAWLPLMPFIKNYTNTQRTSILTEMQLDVDEFRAEFLSQVQSQSVTERLSDKATEFISSSNTDRKLEDSISTHQLNNQNIGYVPNSLPVEVVAVTEENTEVTKDLQHKIRFYARAGNTAGDPIILDKVLPLADLLNKDITLSYQAATQESHRLALSFGGIRNVPLYLLDLRPKLVLQGQSIAVSEGSLRAGIAHQISVDLISPSGTYTTQKSVYSGSFHALGVAAQNNFPSLGANAELSRETLAGKVLSQVAQRYMSDWARSENDIAIMANRVLINPLPTVVFASNDLQVQSLLGQPQFFEWRGVNLDAAFRVTDSVTSGATSLSERDLLVLSALQGSYLEHHIFERYFGVASMSADKGVGLARQSQIPLLSLNSENLIELESTLAAHSSEVINSVRQWLHSNYLVTIPISPLQYFEWEGSVWLVEDPETGGAGYFIARGIAGGATADAWPADIADALVNFDVDEVNPDPASAEAIFHFPSRDFQFVEADAESEALVFFVTDDQGRPVSGAQVTFNIASGAGLFSFQDSEGNDINAANYTGVTDALGLASVIYKSPQIVKDSDIVTFLTEDENAQFFSQVGLSYITASVDRISRPALVSSDFYTVITTPGEASELEHLVGKGPGLEGAVEIAVAHEIIRVKDQFGNAVANTQVNVETAPIRFSGEGVVVHKHRVLTSDCPKIPEITTGCGARQTTLQADVYGDIRVGIIFGRVNEADNIDAIVPAIYPIGVSLENGASIELAYSANRDTSFSFSGPSQFSATSPSGVYRGSAAAKVFIEDDETVESLSASLLGGGTANFTGNQTITYTDMEVGDAAASYNPRIDWTVSETRTDGEIASRQEGVRVPLPVTAVEITPELPEPIELGLDLTYRKFGDFSYTATPESYQPYYAVMDVYEDDQLILNWLVNPQQGESLARGKVTLPPIKFKLGSIYTAEFVFNPGSQFNEIKSKRFPLPLSAPIIRSAGQDNDGSGAGGGGALVVDEVNEVTCTLSNPKFVLNLVQEARVTIETKAPDTSVFTGFIVDRVLPAGIHEFDRNDLGFIGSFWNEGNTRFRVEAQSTEDSSKTEVSEGTFSLTIHDLASLPVGSPVYEDVNLFRGSLNLSRQDIFVPGRGPNIEFTRYYSSGNRTASSLGPGWSHNYDSFLQVTDCGWVIVSGGVAGGVTFFPQDDGTYKAGKGFHSSLKFDQGEWDFYAKDGTRYHYSKIFRINHGAIPDKPRIYLDHIEDKNGNRTSLGYSPVRNAAPQLELIQDSSGRQIKLNYLSVAEITQKILEESIDNPDGSDELASSPFLLYDFPHNIVSSVTGLDYEINYEYDDSLRLKSATSSDVGLGGEGNKIFEQYEYGDLEFQFGLVDVSTAASMVKLTDPRGVETDYVYERTARELGLRFASISSVIPYEKRDVIVKSFIKRDNAPLSSNDISATFEYTGKIVEKSAATALVVDPRGVEYLYKMDRFGRNYETQGPTGTKLMSWAVNDSLMLTSEDENGVLSTYEYDENGNATREEVSGPLGISYLNLSTYTTRRNGTVKTLLESRTDRRGNQTQFGYDINGNLELVSHPPSAACEAPCEEKFSYFANGDRSQMLDERSKRTSYLYDQYGNPKQVRYPIGSASATFDARSRTKTTQDENGNITLFEYDWLNRLVKTTNAEDGIRTLSYDGNNNKLEEKDEEGRRVLQEFDFDNRVVLSKTIGTTGEQISRSLAYDTNDNLVSETDYRGNTTRHTYDDANRKELTTYPENQQGKAMTMRYAYDDASNVVSQTVAGDNALPAQTTSFGYDNLYRQVSITDSENGITSIVYDGNDNLIAQTDELNRVTQYDYDEVNRKIAQRGAVGSPIERSMAWDYDRAGNLIKYTDARGNAENYFYDDRNRQTFKTNFDENRFTYNYDDYGNLREEFDHFGNRIEYVYDGLHRRIAIIDQRNFRTTTSYDRVGNALTESWANGNVVETAYDFLNRPLIVKDSVGDLMSYSYDADNNKLSQSDGEGYLTTYEYDARSQLVKEAQPEGRVLLREYDVYGNVSKSIDGEGNPTSFVYDKLNRQSTLTDANNNTIISSYDAVDNKRFETDRRGNTTELVYDQLNRVIKIIEPDTQTHERGITNEYDANDNLRKTTDKRQIVTEYDYDRLNRMVEERRSGIVVIRKAYSEIGDLIGLQDANNNKTAMEYNGRHEMILESRPETAITSYRYDAMGDLEEQKDPEGRVMSYSYDKRRRKKTETNGENETTSYTYDLNDKQITMERPEGNSWAYTYDELNRLVSIKDGEQQTSSYDYDRQNNVTAQTDANGNRTEYEYDGLNRKKLKRYPLTTQGPAICTYDYDPNDNLLVKTDANGQVDTHRYDVLNRLIQTEYTQEVISVDRDLRSEAMTYDGNNNVEEVTEIYSLANAGTEIRTDTKTYDDFDRLFKRTDSFGKELSYGYDLNGNRTSLTDSDGIITGYTYDGLNRAETVTTTQGVSTYEYDRSSLVIEIKYPNNTLAAYDYDLAKRTSRIHNQQNNAPVSLYEYEFDNNGNRNVQRETNGGSEEITLYDYDNNDRLTEVSYPELITKYTYDAAYNRTGEIDTNKADNAITKNKTYRYNQRNQLTNVDDNLDSANNVSYHFDQNGNQVQKIKGTEQTDFVFDIRDDLRQVQVGGSTVGQFLYDYDGLRIEKIGERGAERSTYDDQSVLQQYDVQGCTNVGDAECVGPTGATRAKFDYGPDRLLSLTSSGEPPQFYLTDALQSVVNLTNNLGAIQARYQYDAWGNKRGEVGGSYNRFGFTGYEEDKETGLLYAKARFYDPDTGKFLSEDAWEGDFMIAPSLHRYLYGYQNPAVYIDVDGNEATPIFSRKVSDKSFQIQPIGTIDTGNVVVDNVLATAASVPNIATQIINEISEVSTYPVRGLSAVTGRSVRALDGDIVNLEATMGPYGRGVKLASIPLTISSRFSKARQLKNQVSSNISQQSFNAVGELSSIPSVVTSGRRTDNLGAGAKATGLVQESVPGVSPQAALPAPGADSFGVGERLVSRNVYDDFISGQSKFQLGAPWDNSFFFNKEGANSANRSLDAAVNAGFTRQNIVDTIDGGGNELVRIRFKTDKLDQIAIPGISKFDDGLGQAPISGTNSLFTGKGRTQTIYGEKGFDEFIGNNVFFEQDDILSAEALGKIKK